MMLTAQTVRRRVRAPGGLAAQHVVFFRINDRGPFVRGRGSTCRQQRPFSSVCVGAASPASDLVIDRRSRSPP
jgi:hypothetical protein